MANSATATPATGTATEAGKKTTWIIDPAHSNVGFSIKHLMIATVRGRFTQVQGTVKADENSLATATIDITIPTAGVDTGDGKRDAHLRSADFFDAERYPNMTFRSKRVEAASGGNSFRVVGDLTIRDVTQQVVLQGEFQGPVQSVMGGRVAGFSLTGEIDREAFGLTWNAALETGGVMVSDEVKLEAEVEFVKA